MTGGGARGAYQAGVLKRIGELKRVQKYGNPFPIVGGSSAGAINAAALAAGCDDLQGATAETAGFWSVVHPRDVFRCDLASHARNSLTWMLDLSFGGIAGGGRAHSLLDATPLHHYLEKRLKYNRIEENIERGHLYAVTIAATNYSSGKGYQFIQGKKGHPVWDRSRRVALPTPITTAQICASAAIPLVFEPVRLETPEGSAFFGDGCLRLQQPLSPAIRLGADKLFAIGVRGESSCKECDAASQESPSLSRVMGVLLNVIFLDHLAADVEHLERLNQVLDGIQKGPVSSDGSRSLRRLETLVVSPSVDLSAVASEYQRDMPYFIQYFVNGLGRDPESCADLMSYLMFTPNYTRTLVNIGYEDAGKRMDEIEEFLFAGEGTAEEEPRPSTRVA